MALAVLIVAACVSVSPLSAPSPEATGPAAAASATPAPTKKPKPRPSVQPTETPTSEPTTTAAPTETPSSTPTPPPTTAPTGGGLPPFFSFPIGDVPRFVLVEDPVRLDYTAPPNHGQANLSAGFVPDPYSVGMTSGGSVDVSYLGGGCSGFATESPDLRVNFGGGGTSLLRIYFIGSSGDTSIVVNDPFGNFYCVDDSFGTVNPTIDFLVATR